MTRDQLKTIGDNFADLRKAYEADCIIISIGSRGPSYDCPNGNAIATVTVGADTETSEAVHLKDAIDLARAKCRDAAERRRKDAEKAKAEKA